jgi:ABC-type molybdenum transport system ATPase subunit/photorepair protein PhrA
MSENQKFPVIEMRGVNVAAMRDASFIVVEDVNWSVAPGEFWVVAGQEHSGKSDLLMLAAGLMAAAAALTNCSATTRKILARRNCPSVCASGLFFKAGNFSIN